VDLQLVQGFVAMTMLCSMQDVSECLYLLYGCFFLNCAIIYHNKNTDRTG